MPTTLDEAFDRYETTLWTTKGMTHVAAGVVKAMAVLHLREDVGRITGRTVRLGV